MARHQAIAATSDAIRLLLEEAAAGSEWAGLDARLVQAEDLQRPPAKPGLWIFLYRVAPGAARRERPPGGPRRPPPVPLELHYLVTAFASEAATAQRMLGWAIRVLDDTPVIDAATLNAYEADVFAPDERVELVWNPLSTIELSALWQAAPQSRSPSASYLARGVALGA